jgi:hypothetical protein
LIGFAAEAGSVVQPTPGRTRTILLRHTGTAVRNSRAGLGPASAPTQPHLRHEHAIPLRFSTSLELERQKAPVIEAQSDPARKVGLPVRLATLKPADLAPAGDAEPEQPEQP